MITKIMVSMSSSNHQAAEGTELNPVSENHFRQIKHDIKRLSNED